MQATLPLDQSLATEKLETGNASETIAESLKHWRCHRDTEQVEWWLIDQQDTGANTLSQTVLRELQELVAGVKERNPKAVVIRSVKTSGFIAGAEISEFRGMLDPEEIEEPLAEAHELLNQLDGLNIPTIALLHGFCLGGGLELALACRYRVARNDTMLGFPEVQLGLHPGLGGTMRLTRQIPAPQALQMMLTGKPIPAKKAKSLGLIDAVGEERHFANAVRQAAKGKLPRRGQTWQTRWLSRTPANRFIARQAEKQTRARVNEKQYPSPFALIKLWRENSGDPEALLEAERHSFADLLSGEQAQNLVRVFFLREALKAEGKGEHGIEHVHVIGAGAMGGDIAAWCAKQGFKVTVEDQAPEYIGPAVKRAHELFQRKLHSDPERQAAHDRFIPDVAGRGRTAADLIIEAIPEKLELKTQLLKELDKVVKNDTIIATNTSSILLERLRDSLKDPGRFVGIHFFNPVAQMQLVEIVTHDQLNDKTRERAQAFTNALGKLPIAVKSSPGFLVNRVLTPYLMEALALVDDGFKKEEIDRAGKQLGMPMGPVELADFIGLDICLHVAETLHAELNQPLYDIPDWFRETVEDGQLGQKTGEGFYKYDDKGKPKKSRVKSPEGPDIQERLLLPILNTCVLCRQEGIVEDNDLLDAAVIFATGFVPFTGGPLHYASDRGVDDIVQSLKNLTEQYGERFTPAKQWKSLINQKEKHDRRQSSAA